MNALNKKEVSEIKKQFTLANAGLARICGCYVNYEKAIISTSKTAFLSLSESTEFKYLEIFKKTLSGEIGKCLFDVGYKAEKDSLLYRMKETALQDKEVVDAFYQYVIEHYQYSEDYYILLAHGLYDIPGGEDVYEYLICSICPVNLSKAELAYKNGNMEERVRDRIMQAPMNGFLYPAFNERKMDVHHALYFAKKDMQASLVENLFQGDVPVDLKQQQEAFRKSLPEEMSFESVQELQQELNELGFDENAELDVNTLNKVLQRVGNYKTNEECQLPKIKTKNLAGKVKVETDTAVITAETDCLETKVIDGRKYILVPAEGQVTINKIPVRFEA